MFTSIYLCAPLFACVSLPIFSHVYTSLPMFPCLLVITYVFSLPLFNCVCLPMFILLYLCPSLLVFTRFLPKFILSLLCLENYWCLLTYIYPCLLLFTYVYTCSPIFPCLLVLTGTNVFDLEIALRFPSPHTGVRKSEIF